MVLVAPSKVVAPAGDGRDTLSQALDLQVVDGHSRSAPTRRNARRSRPRSRLGPFRVHPRAGRVPRPWTRPLDRVGQSAVVADAPSAPDPASQESRPDMARQPAELVAAERRIEARVAARVPPPG